MSSYRERIGITLSLRPADEHILRAGQFEHAGVETLWSTQNALGTDLPTLYAAIASHTSRIKLGTSIVPAFTRHPLTLASQARTIENISPGRLRLGIGTSHQRVMEVNYAIPLDHALTQLKEYLQVLGPALRGEAVDFQGEYYEAHVDPTAPLATPVLISALRENAWELAGELTDGGISWNVPTSFLLETALPALKRGAEAANRETPRLIAHTIVAFKGDGRSLADARAGLARNLAGYTQTVYYPRMWAAAGYPLGDDRRLPDSLIDALLFCSDDDAEFAAYFRSRLDQGIDELLVQLVPGVDRDLDEARLAAIIGNM